MKLSVGVDIIKIDRIKNSIRRKRFLDHVYGAEELEHYYKYAESPEFLAGNFAGKEAFAKALGTGVRGFTLKEVQVLRDNLGAPYFQLGANAKTLLNSKNITISISHEKEFAVAFVVIYD